MSRIVDKIGLCLVNTALTLTGGLGYLGLKRASADPRKSQMKILRKILRRNAGTSFGKDYDFRYILAADNPDEMLRRYREKVPAMEYENVRPYVNRMKSGESDVLFAGKPVMYATTSGSTGEPKWIPESKEYISLSFGRMTRIWMYNLMRLRPLVHSGRSLCIVGSKVEGHTDDGATYGSVSAYTMNNSPRFIRRRFAVPAPVFEISDYTARNYAVLRFALEKDITLAITANPSTMMELQNTLDEWKEECIRDIRNGTLNEGLDIAPEIRRALGRSMRPNPRRADELEGLAAKYGTLKPKHFWPNLQVLSTWKCGNTRIYLNKLEDSFPDGMIHQELAYFASECRAGLVLDDSVDTVVFPHFNFFEFRKASDADNPDAPFLCLDELKEGERYCPYVTTTSGLYRYNMNDVLQVSSKFVNTPRVHLVHKTNGIVSITGEKLYEGQFIGSVEQAQEQTGLDLDYYVSYANLKESRYDWYFEFRGGDVTQKDAQVFAEAVDEALMETNIEYKSKRDSFRLKAPSVFRLKKGAFEKFKAIATSTVRGDASRFKPNVLSQNERLHKIIERFKLKQ
ncbi:MAG: GH3 auxin-responsive promoter family protein [Bacteroidales bacterium]|nr:GH3 auxin-responsive promoter family protein [Bacteroidales bacterium]